MRYFFKVFFNFFKKIRLVDRCLILFMVILLFQSGYGLFANEPDSSEYRLLDVIVRTTSASIFGYFLSANFIKNPTRRAALPPQEDASPQPVHTDGNSNTSSGQMKFAIGFRDPSAEWMAPTPPSLPPAPIDSPAFLGGENDHQIIIATIIGLVSLCLLLFARNFGGLTPASTGTLSQLRDFVSGCVGFLLGTPSSENRA